MLGSMLGPLLCAKLPYFYIYAYIYIFVYICMFAHQNILVDTIGDPGRV